MARVRGYRRAVARVAKIVVMVQWEGIKSQVPTSILEMSVIAPIKSQVTVKAATIHIIPWETKETMPTIISPMKMPLYLMREWQVYQLTPRCLLRANTMLAIASCFNNRIWWPTSMLLKLHPIRDCFLRMVPQVTSQCLPKARTCCRVAMWWLLLKMSHSTTNISSCLKTNLCWTKWLFKPKLKLISKSNKIL